MKKVIVNSNVLKALTVACALGGAPLMITPSLKAENQENIDHKVLVGIVSEFAQYGNALEAFTKNFFGVIPNKFTKNQFVTLAHSLLASIKGIQERTVRYREAVTGEDSKLILLELEKLATLLATSQQKLHEALHKSLGTKNFLPSLKRLGETEAKQISLIENLQKNVNKLLIAHAEKQLKEKFDAFITSIEYSLSYPENNIKQVLSIAVKYSNLK